MKLLHTADWHLNDRLGRIDRTEDLRKAVERIAGYCSEYPVDVLIVAGDLFSELARPDALRETIHHWQEVFADFLGNGGTILTVTGNHDNENFCQTLRHAMALAAPTIGRTGQTVPNGRFYLAAEPSLLRLRDRNGQSEVQFVLMPYPTASRYLTTEARQKYNSPDEKNLFLTRAFEQTLRDFLVHPTFDAQVPAALIAHVNCYGSEIGPSLFRMTIQEDIVVNTESYWDQFAYVALGHIHKPQFLGGREHVRYSGSIERMDLGEQHDHKGVVLFDIDATGRMHDLTTLPLPSTAVYEVAVVDPEIDLPRLQADAETCAEDIVNLHVTYTAGKHNLEAILIELDRLFPRWYARDWRETHQLIPGTLAGEEVDRSRSFAETVRDYLGQELIQHTEDDRDLLLKLADELIQDVE